MIPAELDITEWLEAIDDADDRAAVAAAFEVAAQIDIEDDSDDVFTPFVYPH